MHTAGRLESVAMQPGNDVATRPHEKKGAVSLAAKRPLNVGLVGCGFMGRTHSNAWGKVNQFFDLEYRPVLKAVCARNPEEVQTFAEQWGYQSTETDWRWPGGAHGIRPIDIATPKATPPPIATPAG